MISWVANKRPAEQRHGFVDGLKVWCKARQCVVVARPLYTQHRQTAVPWEGVGQQITNDSRRPNHLQTLKAA